MSFFSQSPPVASTHTLWYVWPWKTSLLGRDGRGKEVAPLDCNMTLSCTRMTAQSWSRGWPALAEQREIAMHFLSWSAIKAAASSHSMVTSGRSFCWIKAQIWIRAWVETPDSRHCKACSTPCPLPDPSRRPSSVSAQNAVCWQFTLPPVSKFSSGLSLFSNCSLTLNNSSLCWLENHLSVTSALLMTRC